MLHWWLIPAIVIFFAGFWILYEVVKHTGGSGVRTEGRTVLDKPGEEDDARIED